MGKNKRRTIEASDSVHNVKLDVDSCEEWDFIQWLCEAHSYGIIDDFQYQPRSFELFDSITYQTIDGKSRSLFREHVYSPDFKIQFNPTKYADLAKEFKVSFDEAQKQQVDVVIDTKGTFASNDGGRSFSINQKWVYAKYKVYVHKLVPKVFFEKFGVPENCKLTAKTKKPRKAFEGFKDIKTCFDID